MTFIRLQRMATRRDRQRREMLRLFVFGVAATAIFWTYIICRTSQ